MLRYDTSSERPLTSNNNNILLSQLLMVNKLNKLTTITMKITFSDNRASNETKVKIAQTEQKNSIIIVKFKKNWQQFG